MVIFFSTVWGQNIIIFFLVGALGSKHFHFCALGFSSHSNRTFQNVKKSSMRMIKLNKHYSLILDAEDGCLTIITKQILSPVWRELVSAGLSMVLRVDPFSENVYICLLSRKGTESLYGTHKQHFVNFMTWMWIKSFQLILFYSGKFSLISPTEGL